MRDKDPIVRIHFISNNILESIEKIVKKTSSPEAIVRYVLNCTIL